MAITLRVKPNAPALSFLTHAQLDAIARSFAFALDPGDEVVHLGAEPPLDYRKRWQETDAYGAAVGAVKTYNGTTWA